MFGRRCGVLSLLPSITDISSLVCAMPHFFNRIPVLSNFLSSHTFQFVQNYITVLYRIYTNFGLQYSESADKTELQHSGTALM